MEQVTDWLALWRALVEVRRQAMENSAGRTADPWHDRARDFDTRSGRRWSDADTIRDFVASQTDPGSTILDIGAGTGRWALFLGSRVRHVTAIEPSAAMAKVLEEKLADEAVQNVSILRGFWPEVPIEPHDVSLASHSVYFTPDLAAFVNRMIEVTRRTCYLVLRAAAHDGVMAEATRKVWGHPYDSPCFDIAYNVLLAMGLRPNVLWDHTLWRPWSSPSIEAALADVKQRLRIEGTTEHDQFLRDLLERRLTPADGQYVWPASTRSVLIYWDVAPVG